MNLLDPENIDGTVSESKMKNGVLYRNVPATLPHEEERTIDSTNVPSMAKIPRSEVHSEGAVDRVRGMFSDHPIPFVLIGMSPFIALLGGTPIAIGLCVGAGLYVLTQLVDQAAVEVLGEAE